MATMVATFGDFSEEALTKAKFHLHLSFPSSSFAGRWKNVSLSANYLASFFETFYRSDAQFSPTQHSHLPEEFQSSISYVANELIENAVKFNFDKSSEIGLTVYYGEGQLIFLVCNSIEARDVTQFQKLLENITHGDLDELLISRMEENFLNSESDSASSGLGLLTIMHDHGAKLGWRFENVAGKPGLKLLTTMASLPMVRQPELIAV